jgi:2-iminobutanoate/2-iminopropanoate deaminase
MKVTHINPDSLLKSPAFSQAVVVEDARRIVYIGEQNGVDVSGAVVGDDLGSQVEHAYKDVLKVLESVGATRENVVKQTILVAKGQDMRVGYVAAQRAWRAHPIALTVHIVDGFGIPGALVGTEAVCALGD